MAFVWLKFTVCTIIIFFSGKRVAKYGDVIAEKTGLGGLWIGVILVAIATSLPEIFTGVGSTLFVNAPNLTIGNLFGANTYNLLNIAALDFLHKGTPLLSSVSIGQLLTAGLSLIPLLIASIGIFLSQKLPPFSFANISLYSILILVSYLVSIRIIFKFEKGQQKVLKELNKEEEALFKYNDISLKKACIFYAVFATMIAGTGIWLAYIGTDLAQLLGLGQNFVGSLFIGFTTTLPEITVSVAALRIGAKELAVANMLGSNLFNMSIIFLNDVLYRRAPLFQVLSQQHIFTAGVVIFMTVIICSALILKPKKKMALRLSNYAIALIITFILGAYVNFILRSR